MTNYITKEAMAAPMTFFNMVKAAVEKGFELVGTLKAHVRYECPACKKEMTKRAALKERTPLPASYTTARHFANKVTKAKMTACPCGYRRVNIPSNTEPAAPSNPIHTAVMGISAGVKDLKSQCTGTTARGARCKRKVTPPSTRCPIHGQNLGF